MQLERSHPSKNYTNTSLHLRTTVFYKPAFCLASLLRWDLALATLKRVKSLLDARFFFAAIFPAILGHEGAGVVVELGEGVTSLEVGDHAVEGGARRGLLLSDDEDVHVRQESAAFLSTTAGVLVVRGGTQRCGPI